MKCYEGIASMRVDVPNANDPKGKYAGAIFRIDGAGRDLSDYDALTFWVKASQGVTIGEFGFGEDFGENKYLTTLPNVSVSTAWTKVIIPIPDASKLLQERGMFRYAAGTQGTGGAGYAFWIDELKFEKLGTLAHPQPAILNGVDVSEQTFIGANTTLTGLTYTINGPNGQNITVNTAPAYYTFNSSLSNVASVNELGVITITGTGTTTITATLGGTTTAGSLTLNSLGNFTPAPTPNQSPNNVISIFSDAYTNVPVEYYNGYWGGSTTLGQDDINLNGDNIIKYTNLNYVGIQFAAPTIDASQMTYFHVDIQVLNATGAGNSIKVKLADFGANGVYNGPGSDDSESEYTITNANLPTGNWVSLDIPMTNFSGLTSKSHLAQVVFVTDSGISDIFVDNVYFYKLPTVPVTPTTAAPTPTISASNVISVFSDAYTNVASNLNPGWGQATVVSQVSIAGNNTLKYSNLNYQGLEFAASQNVSAMTHLHIDYYTTDSSSLKAYLISPGPVETPKTLTTPTAGAWVSLEIPLTDFSPVNIANLIQMKFDGNGTYIFRQYLFSQLIE